MCCFNNDLPSSGKPVQTLGGAAGRRVMTHSCPPLSNPEAQQRKIPLSRDFKTSDHCIMILVVFQDTHTHTRLRNKQDSVLTLPNVEKLSWNKNDKISTRSIPLVCNTSHMTYVYGNTHIYRNIIEPSFKQSPTQTKKAGHQYRLDN